MGRNNSLASQTYVESEILVTMLKTIYTLYNVIVVSQIIHHMHCTSKIKTGGHPEADYLKDREATAPNIFEFF